MTHPPTILWTLSSPPPELSHPGLRLVHVPFLRIKHLRNAVDPGRLERCGSVIVTSANAIPGLAPHIQRLAHLPFYAVGAATATALRTVGAASVTTPPEATGRALVQLLQAQPPAPDVLFPRGTRGGETVLAYLDGAGLPYYSPVVYRSEPRSAGEITAELPQNNLSAVVLGSPSAADVWREVAPQVPELRLCTIGPTTSAACHEHGLQVWLQAESGSAHDLIRRLTHRFQPAGRAA